MTGIWRRRGILAVLTLGLWGLVNVAQAQIVNVMGMLNEDKQGLFLSVSGNADIRTGNVNFALVEGAVLLRLIHKQHLLLLTGSGGYGVKDDAGFTSYGFGHTRYRFNFIPWLAVEVYGQAEYDVFRRLTLRGLAGGGLVFSWEFSKAFEISIGSTYMFEINRYSGDFTYPNGGAEKIFHRWNNYIYLNFTFRKHLALIHTTYLQPHFGDFSDWRLLVDSTLSIRLWKWLSLTVSHVLAYQSRPPVSPTATVAPLDNAIKVGLKSNFFLWRPKPGPRPSPKPKKTP